MKHRFKSRAVLSWSGYTCSISISNFFFSAEFIGECAIFYTQFATRITLVTISVNKMELWSEHFETQVQASLVFCSVPVFATIRPMKITHSNCLFSKPFFSFIFFVLLARNNLNDEFPWTFIKQDKWQHQNGSLR